MPRKPILTYTINDGQASITQYEGEMSTHPILRGSLAFWLYSSLIIPGILFFFLTTAFAITAALVSLVLDLTVLLVKAILGLAVLIAISLLIWAAYDLRQKGQANLTAAPPATSSSPDDQQHASTEKERDLERGEPVLVKLED